MKNALNAHDWIRAKALSSYAYMESENKNKTGFFQAQKDSLSFLLIVLFLSLRQVGWRLSGTKNYSCLRIKQ